MILSQGQGMKAAYTRLKRLSMAITCSFLLLLPTIAEAFSPYTSKELEQLEKEFVEQINQANNIIRDPLATQYINHLGKTLAQHGQMPTPYFFLVQSNQINAFAGPGGYIGINSELILASDSESELAGVMSHEMAHVRLLHLYRLIEHQKDMRIPMLASMLAAIALGAINPSLGSGALMATLGGFTQNNINFIRSNEKEADRIGIDMLIKSGLDPRGMAAFFKKLQQHSRYYYTENIPALLRTHPLDEDRIAEAEGRCVHLHKSSYPDSVDYPLFKELIRTNMVNDNKKLLDYYANRCKKNEQNHACRYGRVLAFINMNQFQEAKKILFSLLSVDSNNLFYIVAMARAEIGLQEFDHALQRLASLYANYPDNYAAISSYAEGLIAANKTKEAASILLKGTRKFKTDLILCNQLARAESKSQRKGYAYFTEARCQLLQGRKKEALRQLKIANTFASKDKMLQQRIQAKTEEINDMLEK
jgi:beta-barrel assembly-enhancing protease